MRETEDKVVRNMEDLPMLCKIPTHQQQLPIQQIPENQQHPLQVTEKSTNETKNRAHTTQQLSLPHQKVRNQKMRVLLGQRTVRDNRNSGTLPIWMPGICGGTLQHGQSSRLLLKRPQGHHGKYEKDNGAAQVHRGPQDSRKLVMCKGLPTLQGSGVGVRRVRVRVRILWPSTNPWPFWRVFQGFLFLWYQGTLDVLCL